MALLTVQYAVTRRHRVICVSTETSAKEVLVVREVVLECMALAVEINLVCGIHKCLQNPAPYGCLYKSLFIF